MLVFVMTLSGRRYKSRSHLVVQFTSVQGIPKKAYFFAFTDGYRDLKSVFPARENTSMR